MGLKSGVLHVDRCLWADGAAGLCARSARPVVNRGENGMCGICGFVSTVRKYRGDLLESMSGSLRHRGPDAGGWYLTSTGRGAGIESLAEGNVGLGHRRLSIIDLSDAGRQPMACEDGTVYVVFNGEIYNFKELKKLLEPRHSFRSGTDTEVLVHGYEEWGTDLFEKLNGMFAIGIWDARLSRLVLARDKLGIKPLYIYRGAGELVFASELHAIRRHPSFRGIIDEKSAELFFNLSYVPAPRSIFRNVEKLLPGYYAVFRGGTLAYGRYWEEPRLAGGNGEEGRKFEGSFDEAADRLEILLADSVRRRMVADVPVGAFLSGGIDSSLVVSMMNDSAAGRVRTYCIGFEDERFNECPYARIVADHIGTEHSEFILDPDRTEEIILRVGSSLDEPIGDPSAVPTWLVSDLTRRNGIVVALSGDGGDELFCGYQRYDTMAKLLAFDRLPAALRRPFFGAAARMLPGRLGRAAGSLAYDDYAGSYFARMKGWKKGDVDIFPRSPDPSILSGTLFQDVAERARGLDPLDRLMLIDLKTYMVDDVLAKVDRMSMSVSLEVRVPLLDHRIVEFAATLPAAYKYRRGNLKAVLKEVAFRRIPRGMLERPKSGFGLPVGEWLRKDLCGLFRGFLSDDIVAGWGLLDPAKVSLAVRGFENGTTGNARFIWGLLMFAIWAQGNGLRDGETAPVTGTRENSVVPAGA